MDQRRRFSAFVPSGQDVRPTILDANAFAREFIEQCDIDVRVRAKVVIIVEELVSNSLRHCSDECNVNLSLTLSDLGEKIALEFEDDAPEFDPVNAPEADGPNPKTGGGIGLAIIKAWGKDLSYARKDGHNILSLNVS